MPRFLILTVLLTLLAPSILPAQTAIAVTGDTTVHDPSIIQAHGRWYVFSTGKTATGGQFSIRCSSDLKAWTLCGQVFDTIPQWIQQRSPGTKDLWAPDISFVDGRYRLYYCYSLFGKNTSGIALATASTLDPADPDHGWRDEGLVFESRASDNFNAIDPNFFRDDTGPHASGRDWLAFGSFWDGIKLLPLDRTTGRLAAPDSRPADLARRAPASATPTKTAAGDVKDLPPDTQAIEAPFLVQHDGFYYLFTSWDLCCRGAKSTYHTVAGRAANITGPYLDRKGTPLAAGGGTPLLSATRRWAGPGGESVAMGTTQGDILVFHAYDPATGKPAMQLSTLAWKDGWPAARIQ